MKLSVVVPTDEKLFNLDAALAGPDIELIFVGLGEASTRAERLNLGVERCRGEMILFHHPRSRLENAAFECLIRRSTEKIWGGFTHQFDHPHFLLKFTSFYSNNIRARLRGIIYLDHCIFFHHSLWQASLPAIEIFEDTVLSSRLNRLMRPLILPQWSTTSAVRFLKNGVYRQSLRNQLLKIGFHLKVSPRALNEYYEKGLGLNAEKKATSRRL